MGIKSALFRLSHATLIVDAAKTMLFISEPTMPSQENSTSFIGIKAWRPHYQLHRTSFNFFQALLVWILSFTLLANQDQHQYRKDQTNCRKAIVDATSAIISVGAII